MIQHADLEMPASGTEGTTDVRSWSARLLRSCEPDVLSLILALLLDGEELRDVLAQGSALGEPPWSMASMIKAAVARIRSDQEFAERLCERLARHAGCEPEAERWSPYQALEAWACRGAGISSTQIARVLSTLAFSRDPILVSLAGRVCGEVQLEAIQRLRSAGTLVRGAERTRI